MTKYNEDFIIIDDENKNFNQKITLDATIYNIFKQLEQINKNLEKIANNTEKGTGVSIPTINAIGNFFKEETRKLKELDSDPIICNKNKDSHVDKNIILD